MSVDDLERAAAVGAAERALHLGELRAVGDPTLELEVVARDELEAGDLHADLVAALQRDLQAQALAGAVGLEEHAGDLARGVVLPDQVDHVLRENGNRDEGDAGGRGDARGSSHRLCFSL